MFLNNNVYAFNTITPNSNLQNINQNIHGDPIDTNGNYYHYRTYNNYTGYANFGAVIGGKFNGFIGYVSGIKIIGGYHYTIQFNTSTRDLRPNWTSSDIKVCTYMQPFVGDCATVSNISLLEPNGAGTYYNKAKFDFYFPNLPNNVEINNDLLILINGTITNNPNQSIISLGLNNKDLSGDNNWKFDTVQIKVASIDSNNPDSGDSQSEIVNKIQDTKTEIQTGNNILTRIWNSLTSFFDSFWTNMTNTFTIMLRPLIDGLGGISNWLSDIYDTIFGGIQDWLEKIWIAIIGIIGSIGDIQDWLVDTLTPILINIFQFLKDAIVNFIASFITFIHYISNLPSPIPYLLKLMIWTSLGFAIWRLIK